MPLQKSSGVAILVSLQERQIFLHMTVHRSNQLRKATGQNLPCVLRGFILETLHNEKTSDRRC